MIFQHRCRIKADPEDLQFAQKAMCTPGMAREDADLILGRATLWDGDAVEVRLCGVPDKPAFMAAALFAPDGGLKDFVRFDTYQSGFEFTMGSTEYVVSMCAEKALEKGASKSAEEKVPPRSSRGQER